MQSACLGKAVQNFQITNAHRRILQSQVRIKVPVAVARKFSVLTKRTIKAESAAADQTSTGSIEHALYRCNAHYVCSICREYGIELIVSLQRLFNIQYQWSLDVIEIGAFQPGVDTMMICDQITGLPGKPRHLAREKNCMLAGAGTDLKDCLAILKLVADHLENSVLVAQSGWRVWLCHR